MNDCFGYSVAVAGNTAVVGSVLDSSFADMAGSAYIFDRSGTTWSQTAEISANDIVPIAHFGYAVALDGSTCIVGAPLAGLLFSGAAYVYEFSPSNTAPVANPQSVTTSEDAPAIITLTGTDAEGDPLSFTILSGATKGALTGTPPNLIYVPQANANGADSFTFILNDGQLDSAPATVSINITPVNDPPTIGEIADLTVAEDSASAPVTLAVTVGDVDNDPGSLIVSASSDNPVLVPDGSIS